MKRYLVYATIAATLVVVAVPALAGKGGRAGGVITVADTVHGGTTTATVNPGGEDVHVYVRCYTPDLGGQKVYFSYTPVDGSGHATIGPLASSLWRSGAGACTAEEGYFTRSGLGKWVVVAETTFQVAA
jgi:hypothetical protein